MKLHKLISRTVLATALLGATFSGAFSGVNVHADSNGDTNKTNTSRKVKAGNNNPFNGNFNGTTKSGVKDGFLTLDSVPNLSFGNNGNSINNKSYSTDDGQPSKLNLSDNNNGTLRVTDYRNIDKNTNTSSSKSGWKLTAQVDKFSNDAHNGTDDDWYIDLNNGNNFNNTDPFNTGQKSSPELDSEVTRNPRLNDDNNPYIIINTMGHDNTGYGINTINYNDINDASLEIPNVPSGTYTANMTWNLSTTLGSYGNDAN